MSKELRNGACDGLVGGIKGLRNIPKYPDSLDKTGKIPMKWAKIEGVENFPEKIPHLNLKDFTHF